MKKIRIFIVVSRVIIYALFASDKHSKGFETVVLVFSMNTSIKYGESSRENEFCKY